MNNTLLKGLSVLELLSRSPRPLSLTQIGKELGMGKSNVHRLMQALVETRFVLREEESGTYTPSIKLWELGSAVLGKLDLRRHAERQMERLMEHTGESVHLSVLDGLEVVYVHKVDSERPVRAYTQIGGRVPAYCVATGKAQLAFAREHVLQSAGGALQQHTAHTITNRDEFLKEMQKVRQRGYAINRAEWREDVWGIAAPVMDTRGFVIAAVGISGPASRFRKSVLAAWADAVIATATDVSDALGGDRPPAALNRVRLGTADEPPRDRSPAA
ncbi:MAG: IclR family transcriptional regulator [Gammaproteobacteria bacterium]|nr:IclR family transcriptional regulator [Gammaproteobacteria bacterium]